MTVKDTRKIKAVAFKLNTTGEIISSGGSHSDLIACIGRMDRYREFEDAGYEEGFIDQNGYFYNREEAMRIARRTAEFKREPPSKCKKLCSFHLW